MKGKINLSFRSVKRLKMFYRCILLALKKSRTSSGVLVYSYFKDGEFTAVKRNAKLLTRYVKGVPFVKIGI